MIHNHICQVCGKLWECNESTPIWDQEDTDCRWWIYVKCKEHDNDKIRS